MEGYKKNILHILPIILLFIFLVISMAKLYPIGNEGVYALQLYKVYHSEFLSNDWIFTHAGNEHFCFNWVFGLFTIFLPLSIYLWIARVLCWLFIIIIIFFISDELHLNRWVSFGGILLWISMDQSLAAYSLIITGYEASSVSYIFLLLSILFALKEKWLLSAVFIGLCFSFHIAVGLFGGIAFCIAIFFTLKKNKEMIYIFFIALTFSLPGLISSFLFVSDITYSVADLKYLIMVRMPHHLDPFFWSKKKIIILIFMFLFNILYQLKHREKRYIFFFQIGIAIPFFIGFILRALKIYRPLIYFPFRLFPVLIPLIFFLYFFDFILYKKNIRILVLYIFLIIIMLIVNPIMPIQQKITDVVYSYKKEETSLIKVAKWASENLEGTFLAAPWEKNIWYYLKNPVFINFMYFPYNSITEWRNRCELIFGEIPEDTNGPKLYKLLEEKFNSLSQTEILTMSKKYSIDYLISESDYSFPLIFNNGNMKIYKIKL